jgi:GPH family glycoside/pentoside/hexuronide:cation symporter
MGATFGVVAVLAILITGFLVRERHAADMTSSRMPALPAILGAFKNRPFMRLMLAIAASNLAFTLLTSLVPYFLNYQLSMARQVPMIMLSMLVTIGVFLYPAKMLSDRINKGPAFAAGLLIASAAIVCAFFLPRGPSPAIYAIAVVAGIGFSANFVFPAAMISDVVEFDERETGERHEGIYFGIWAFLSKLTAALAIAVTGWGLTLFGYVPNIDQTARSLLGIRLLFTIIPAATLVLILPLLVWYPITRKRHAQLIEQMNHAQESAAAQRVSDRK